MRVRALRWDPFAESCRYYSFIRDKHHVANGLYPYSRDMGNKDEKATGAGVGVHGLLSEWRADFRKVVTELELARARLKKYEAREELARIEAARAKSVEVSELRKRLDQKARIIEDLQASRRRHEATMANFRQHFSILQAKIADLRSARQDANAPTQDSETSRVATKASPPLSGEDLAEFQILEAAEFLETMVIEETQMIDMKKPLLEARRATGK